MTATLLSLLVLLLVAGAAGCPAHRQDDARTVADGLGRMVSVPARPRRIVSLAPNVTDTLVALGLRDRLVGITDFCRLPGDASPTARIGGMLNPNLEMIRSLDPDLLVGSTSGNDPAFAAQAEALGIAFYALHTPDVEAMLRSLRALADALGEPARGEALAAALERRLTVIAGRVDGLPRPRVLFIVWGEPLVVPGRTAYLTDALRRAGGDSITGDAPAAWPAFDVELAIARAPDVILTTADNRAMVETLAGEPAWREVPAVRSARVHVVSDAIQQPGPRVVDGIEEVALLLHPTTFESASAMDGTPK